LLIFVEVTIKIFLIIPSRNGSSASFVFADICCTLVNDRH